MLALFIACIGLYGLMSYVLGGRTREFGLRMALGSQPGGILRIALGQGAVLVVSGIVIGLAGAFAASRLFASLLYNTAPNDVVTYIAGAGVLAAIGCGVLCAGAAGGESGSDGGVAILWAGLAREGWRLSCLDLCTWSRDCTCRESTRPNLRWWRPWGSASSPMD